ncbi:MAG: CdaR family protein [Chlamydiota bacterium]
MRTLLKAILIQNWPRKCLSVALAISIWFLVNHSLTDKRIIYNVPIKVENVPPGKVVESGNSRLTVDLTLTGKKNILKDLNDRNIVVVFNATGQKDEWIATIRKENIRTTNPHLSISQAIRQVSRQTILIKLVNQVTEDIPIIITPPIGKAPEGYEFVDIWPQKLYVTVTGSEERLALLKSAKVKLTFNLNKIDKQELDHSQSITTQKGEDAVSFLVPNQWKRVAIAQISPQFIPINDPAAKNLRIDFIRKETLKVNFPIPINLYFPPTARATHTAENTTLAASSWIKTLNGMPILNTTLYAKGVSPLFLEIVKNMLEIVVIIPPNWKKNTCLTWGLQLINRTELENRYVQALLSPDGGHKEHQETYLRNLFRNYSHRLQLFLSENEKFNLCPQLSGDSVVITKKQPTSP